MVIVTSSVVYCDVFSCLMGVYLLVFFFFFFSSRRRHTRLTCDWSSDVCSSDLGQLVLVAQQQLLVVVDILERPAVGEHVGRVDRRSEFVSHPAAVHHRRLTIRSEERRVGKECRSRWLPEQEKEKVIYRLNVSVH